MLQLALLAAAFLLSACSRRPRAAHYQFDFIARFESAVSSDPRDFLGLLLPRDGVSVRAVGGRSVQAIAGPRALFDCTLDPGVPAELYVDPRAYIFLSRDPPLRLDVLLNRTRLATVKVVPHPSPRRIRLPRGAIRRGLNSLALVPSRTAPAMHRGPGGDTRRLSVFFPTLALRLGGPAPGERTARIPHPHLVMKVEREGRRVLMQRRVRYRLTLPEAPHLRFGIGASQRALVARRAPVPFEITLRRRGREEVIFRTTLREVAAGGPGWHDFDLPLAGEAGEKVEITFTTRPLPPPDRVWGWANPVLVSATERERSRERNVLVVALDTVRADHLSCYGYTHPTTPSIDALARDGTIFTAATAQAPWTLPSFASFFTSRYPGEHGAGSVEGRRDGQQKAVAFLDYGFETLPEYLKRHGYSTLGYVTNPYLGWITGLAQGFDTYLYRTVAAPTPVGYVRRWLERHRGEQFFVFLHLNDAHEPTSPPPSVFQRFYEGPPVANIGRYAGWGYGKLEDPQDTAYLRFRRIKTALYDASLAYMDEQLGALFAALEDLGEYRRTVVVVLADHGEEFWDHAALEKRYYRDYRGIWGIGHGHTLFRELLHVPLVLKGLGAGQPPRIDQRVGLVDLYPTILDELGLPVPPGLSGRSLAPLLAGQDLPEVPQLAEDILYGPARYSVIYGGWHYIRAPADTDLYFDLASDREEQRPLFAPPPAIREDLGRLVDSFLRRLSGHGPAPPAVGLEQLDPETRRRLKALGYL